MRYKEVPELTVKEFSSSSTIEIEPKTSPAEFQEINLPEDVSFMFFVFSFCSFIFELKSLAGREKTTRIAVNGRFRHSNFGHKSSITGFVRLAYNPELKTKTAE